MMKHLLISGLTAAACSAGAMASDFVTPLPQLANSTQWQADGRDAQALKLSSTNSALGVAFQVTPGFEADMLLHDPVAIPDQADDLSFLINADSQSVTFDFDAIIQDGHGKQWFAFVRLPGETAYRHSLGMVDAKDVNGRTLRLSIPALVQADPGNFRSGSVPDRPWKLLGFRFSGDPKTLRPTGPVRMFLRNFNLTHELAAHSEYGGVIGEITGAPIAYGGHRVEFSTELDGDPGVSVFNFYKGAGLYQVTYQLYDNYAGAPIDSRSASFLITEDPSLAMQLAQTLKFSRQAPGTYWVRWRVHYFPSGKDDGAPADIVSGEQRLFVYYTAGQSRLVNSPPVLAPGWLAIHPLGASFISPSQAGFGVRVEAHRPGASVPSGEIKVTVRTNHLHTEVKTLDLPVNFSGGDVARADVDLSSLPPGPYKVDAEFLVDGKVQDRQEVLAGIQNAAGPSTPLAKLPDGVLDWKQAFARRKPYFYLSPMWHSATWFMPGHNRWEWYKNFLDQAPAVSNDVEYETPWSILEPLPGVFDWEEMDLFLGKSQEEGLQVLVWPGFWGEEPAWLPCVPGQSKDGHIFFDFVYDFYGVRQDYANSPELQNDLLSAMHSIVDHTRTSPAVQGYFIIQELPGDATFANWTGGYSRTEKAAYRDYLKTLFGSPDILSGRWGRAVRSFEEIEPPDDKASDREWLDWLIARANACDKFMQHLLEGVRKEDPLRPIFVYGDLFGTTLKTSDVAAMGCAKANGGSHDAMHPFLVTSIGQHGVMQRTEDHFPGKWTAYFPEVLDSSIFAMSFGGGLGMNCKAYAFTYLPELKGALIKFDNVRKPPYSFDKYEKFMPYWTAMRPTERMPVDVIELLDTEAALLNGKALTRNGFWDGGAELACYRSQVYFAADEFPGVTKCRLMIMIKDGLDNLTRERIDQIKAWVAGGGNLLMMAHSGRKCVDEPQSDWVLLRETGFSTPSDSSFVKGTVDGDPVSGQPFASGLKRFAISGRWPHTPGSGENVVAVAAGSKPLVSWKPYGKGRIAVIWGDRFLPRDPGETDGNLLKAAASWAGVPEVMSSTTPLFWMNLLREIQTGQYFGLVHAGQWEGKPTTLTEGKVSFRLDPAASYHVTELITGSDLGIRTGSSIWSDGIDTSLTPRQTAIYQFDPVKPTAAR